MAQWVEYVDAFGRQRLCLRKDLPTLKEMEAAAGVAPRVEVPTYQHPLFPESQPPPQEVLCTRSAHACDGRQAGKKASEPMHYQDVSRDDVRAMGTGYFAFSSDEAARAEQLAALNKLRSQVRTRVCRARRFTRRRRSTSGSAPRS